MLKKYGGLWIDATVLLTDKIMDEIITRDFITCPEKNDDLYFVSKYKWNTSILGGKVNLPIFSFVANMFNDYWAKENKIIDYYLFDYLIALGYRNVPKIREEIDSHPFINPQNTSCKIYSINLIAKMNGDKLLVTHRCLNYLEKSIMLVWYQEKNILSSIIRTI